jgi:predicted RNase H-related nuclease YkuK (DUF458 family)
MEKWKRYGKGEIDLPITDYLTRAIESEIKKGSDLLVCIGTDSQRHGNRTKFTTVILLISKGSGGNILYNNKYSKNYSSIKEKMIAEVAVSMEVAQEICWVLDLYDVDFEFHADINTKPNTRSHVALAEAVGWVRGMGYTFKAKPDAYAASHCADKICKRK